jgi:site-specific DNA-methyltransferase (adenine-specific)
LVKTYTNEGETVLDNCVGSGTTALACVNTRRNCIAFEKNTEYYELCKKRINELLGSIKNIDVTKDEGTDYCKWIFDTASSH